MSHKDFGFSVVKPESDDPPRNAALAAVLLRAAPYLNPEARRHVRAFCDCLSGGASTPQAAVDLPSDEFRRPESILDAIGIRQPPVDPKMVARAVGIAVAEWDFDDAVSGVLLLDEGRRLIGYNRNHPECRQRFSVAHELGHYCLGHNPTLDVYLADPMGGPGTVFERQANAFAAELLMPRLMVRKSFGRFGEDLPWLAREFGVSQQAMWIRLVELGLATEPTMGAF